MKGRKLLFIGVALALLSAGSIASAQEVGQPSSPIPSQTLGVASDVNAAYDTFHIQPIWFRAGIDNPALGQLTAILQRAPFDGFAEGPQLAAQIQATIAQVRASPAAAPDAEKVLSTAWVRYVQALKRPTEGMIYAYPTLKPQSGAAEVLLTAAAAPSLSTYLTATSNLNPVYQQLRDAAWAEAQASNNFTPDPRLLANLDRARSIPAQGKFVLIDSGNQKLTMFDNGQPVDSMKVIVGTDQLPTPLVSSVVYYVAYNPYWHAPDHLVRKIIAPAFLRGGMKYFKSHGYHVIDAWSADAKEIDPRTVDWKGAAAGTKHLLIRQDPGPLNSMGSLKFPFANPEGIYMHDTPGKELFAKNVRNLSNGCIRLEDAHRFGRWLLGHDPQAPSKDPETQVQLPQAVPVIVTYLTAEVKDGKLTYLNDIYGWDKPGAKVIASTN
ncbi:MAG TPA: L,D-transpeptidase family protein [Sphingomicrobium sp.]|nr:L,D-transpeptidase family protein [Sphingomicrobium sp.]